MFRNSNSTPTWPKPLPNKWITGQIPGIAVDSHDHIWVTNRPRLSITRQVRRVASTAECCFPAPPVLEFDMDGNLVQGWGGPGQGYEWPENEHGIFVDYKDNVWIGGNGNGKDAKILKFTKNGKFLLQIGHHGKSKAATTPRIWTSPRRVRLSQPTNELFVADGYANRRVIVFDADTGAYKRHWGAYGKKPEDLKNPPREQIITGPPPTFFNPPVHGVVVSNDGSCTWPTAPTTACRCSSLTARFVKEAFVKRDTLDAEGSGIRLRILAG